MIVQLKNKDRSNRPTDGWSRQKTIPSCLASTKSWQDQHRHWSSARQRLYKSTRQTASTYLEDSREWQRNASHRSVRCEEPRRSSLTRPSVRQKVFRCFINSPTPMSRTRSGLKVALLKDGGRALGRRKCMARQWCVISWRAVATDRIGRPLAGGGGSPSAFSSRPSASLGMFSSEVAPWGEQCHLWHFSLTAIHGEGKSSYCHHWLQMQLKPEPVPPPSRKDEDADESLSLMQFQTGCLIMTKLSLLNL